MRYYYLIDRMMQQAVSQVMMCHFEKELSDLKVYPVQFDFLGFSFQPLRFRLKGGGRHFVPNENLVVSSWRYFCISNHFIISSLSTILQECGCLLLSGFL